MWKYGLAAVVVAGIVAATSVFTVDSDSHLIAHYTFDDDTATDSSGNGNDGVVNGPVLTAGKVGAGALAFDGSNDYVDLPNTVTLKVVECDPAIKGATATAVTKSAKLETGLEIQVPPYLSSGETIKVDTRDGHFVSRA